MSFKAAARAFLAEPPPLATRGSGKSSLTMLVTASTCHATKALSYAHHVAMSAAAMLPLQSRAKPSDQDTPASARGSYRSPVPRRFLLQLLDSSPCWFKFISSRGVLTYAVPAQYLTPLGKLHAVLGPVCSHSGKALPREKP